MMMNLLGPVDKFLQSSRLMRMLVSNILFVVIWEIFFPGILPIWEVAFIAALIFSIDILIYGPITTTLGDG